jgi:hypothetical protein
MIIASQTCGMGDILILTSIAKHFPDYCTIQLQPEASRFARFFKNISKDIVVTNEIQPTPEIGDGHYALRKLRALGCEDKCYMPYVYVDEKEKQEGLKLIKDYHNPIVFVANSAKRWKFDREPKYPFFQPIIDKLSENHTILQFGISDNFTEYKNTVPMVDIPIDLLIQYYVSIGKFIGIDTGDTHLMLAVGGSCDVFIPKPKFRIPELWNYDHSKVRYYYFN